MAAASVTVVRHGDHRDRSKVTWHGICCPACGVKELTDWIANDNDDPLEFLPINIATSDDPVNCARCGLPLHEPSDSLVVQAIATASTAATLNAHRDELIRELHAAGFSLRRIGDLVGLTHSGVQRVLDRA